MPTLLAKYQLIYLLIRKLCNKIIKITTIIKL